MRILAPTLVSFLLITGCSAESSQSNVAPAVEVDRCVEVDRQFSSWESQIDGWAAEREIAQEGLERARLEDWDGGVTDDGLLEAPPTYEYAVDIERLDGLMNDQLVRMAYLIGDNPECFTPGEVADAKRIIGQFE